MIKDGWVVMSLGVLTKHYGPGDEDKMPAHRTTYHCAFYAVANAESQASYRALFQGATVATQRLCGIDLRAVVAQYHSDWHAGEEAARADSFPRSVRAGDFAHLVGATARTSKARPTSCDTVLAWRKGVAHTARENLDNKELARFVMGWVYATRCIPTAQVFHTCWSSVFQTLSRLGETRCVLALQRHYFRAITAAHADAVYGMRSWLGGATVWIADWWAGVQHLQPGSASGTQAQESWHRHKLKKFVRTMRLTIGDFLARLERFSVSQSKQLALSTAKFPDVPQEPYPDDYLLDGEHLTRRGRTGAHVYHNRQAYDQWVDPADATHFFAMRRHHATWDEEKPIWQPVPPECIRPPPAGKAQDLATLWAARTEADTLVALTALGCSAPLNEDMTALMKAVSGWVLVAVGPFAEKHWKRHGATATGERNGHTQALCFNCKYSAVHGTCEHVHAALLALDPAQRDVAKLPQRARRGPAAPTGASPNTLLSPGRLGVQAPESRRRQGKPCAQEAFVMDPAVRRMLVACGLGHFEANVRQEQISLWDLKQYAALPAEQGLVVLKAMLPSLPGAPARRLLAMAVAEVLPSVPPEEAAGWVGVSGHLCSDVPEPRTPRKGNQLLDASRTPEHDADALLIGMATGDRDSPPTGDAEGCDGVSDGSGDSSDSSDSSAVAEGTCLLANVDPGDGGKVHASPDGKRVLCTGAVLRHGMVVSTTTGYDVCRHPTGRCQRAIREANFP